MNEMSFFEIRVSEMLLFICNQVSLDHTSGQIEEIITIFIHFSFPSKYFHFLFQRLISELDQKLRTNVEQQINTGKRLYTIENKDSSSGVESAGKMKQNRSARAREREWVGERERGRSLPFIVLSLRCDLL